MSRMSELSYDIEQLYIEGHSPRTIAAMLDCDMDVVYGWIESNNVDAAEHTEQSEHYSA